VRSNSKEVTVQSQCLLKRKVSLQLKGYSNNKIDDNYMKKLLKIFALVSTGSYRPWVFILSGFVKAVDPIGGQLTNLLITSMLSGMKWLEPSAFYFIYCFKWHGISIGVFLILFIQNKLAKWGALLFMVLFTPLYLMAALLATLCRTVGCCWWCYYTYQLANFYKNIIILLGLAIFSFAYRNSIKEMDRK